MSVYGALRTATITTVNVTPLVIEPISDLLTATGELSKVAVIHARAYRKGAERAVAADEADYITLTVTSRKASTARQLLALEDELAANPRLAAMMAKLTPYDDL
jgi:hypothetical protein